MPPSRDSDLEALQMRLDRLDKAVFGDPQEPKSVAILPTLARLSAYLDAACWVWRAVLAAVPTCTAIFGVGRAMAWW